MQARFWPSTEPTPVENVSRWPPRAGGSYTGKTAVIEAERGGEFELAMRGRDRA